ncbi:hypothetical protein C9374_003389 [Naegleria lovaniensis]|uniref:RWD domain-containing protein n=1 Tax=Naegleria lovaniensis TaxID=51637 RepID=A0AA88GSZ8_NAELO|nr:uncharacterized protein C9374_013672 [Naegleria lovaniensis]XP_044549567.1 uncharacterized protein C9374_003389 [Naegleria lovaniensis]KAG2372664.1 hypothetical protein C9374_013672 [Naegleria lovaniensis]KAG2385574.1 hypothetical protein C9374_003389 [Naegleria lovaniensis]
MSSNQQEQQLEIEALQSIYPTELTLLSDTHFKIEIFPYTVESETEVNDVGITLEVTYHDDYPSSSIPHFDIYNTRGNITNRTMNELKELLVDTANQFMGTSCVFTLASTIQEFLIKYQQEQSSSESTTATSSASGTSSSSANDSSLDRFTMDSEVLVSNIGRGTPVTPENFKEWRDKFVQEQQKVMEKERAEKAKRFPGAKTGRQIFEERQQLLISKIGEEAAQQYVDEDEIDEELFLNEEDEEDDYVVDEEQE